MNKNVVTVIKDYKERREEVNYSIFDIEKLLKELAQKGMIWTLKEEDELYEAEQILVEYYLNLYRHLQNYDGLESKEERLTNDKSTSFNPHAKPTQHPTEMPNLKIQQIDKFIAYKKAVQLERKVEQLTNNITVFEKYHMIDQVTRSTASIRENIAKGEQHFIKQKFNNYSVAIGSAIETRAWIDMSLSLGYIDGKGHEEVDILIDDIVSILISTLKNLKDEHPSVVGLLPLYVPNIRSFNAYTLGIELVKKAYQLSNNRMFSNNNALQKGLKYNATSVVANIAESNQLYVKKKFVFLNQALAALQGLNSAIESAVNLNKVSETKVQEIKSTMIMIEKIVLKTLSNISSRKCA